jgi:hypothetical protein
MRNSLSLCAARRRRRGEREEPCAVKARRERSRAHRFVAAPLLVPLALAQICAR